jgi:uncharacterized protein YjbI with pentapeptide repeats
MKNIFSYAQYIFEAMAPNFVLKGHVTGDIERKNYLMTTDGEVYRGNISAIRPHGRKYEVTEFRNIKKYNTDFSDADFSGIDMTNSFFRVCSFDMADMTGAIVDGARFENCSFVGATGVDGMKGARFENCKF